MASLATVAQLCIGRDRQAPPAHSPSHVYMSSIPYSGGENQVASGEGRRVVERIWVEIIISGRSGRLGCHFERGGRRGGVGHDDDDWSVGERKAAARR